MKIYQYKDYNEYKQAQVDANVKKLKNVWVEESTIYQIKNFKTDATQILCHGVRNGKELEFFKKYYPSSQIIGTEISHTAKQFKNVVEWDFHNEKEEWKNKFDIVYSNSWDHSYDPTKSLSAWKDQLTNSGHIFLEHAYEPNHNEATIIDPLEIYHEEIKKLSEELGLIYVDTLSVHATEVRYKSRKTVDRYKSRVYIFGKK